MKRIAIILSLLNRGKMYISLLNFAMIFKVFTDSINVAGWVYPVGGAACLFGAVLVGWVDRKLKLRSHEQKYVARQNPVAMETLKKINKILCELKKSGGK